MKPSCKWKALPRVELRPPLRLSRRLYLLPRTFYRWSMMPRARCNCLRNSWARSSRFRASDKFKSICGPPRRNLSRISFALRGHYEHILYTHCVKRLATTCCPRVRRGLSDFKNPLNLRLCRYTPARTTQRYFRVACLHLLPVRPGGMQILCSKISPLLPSPSIVFLTRIFRFSKAQKCILSVSATGPCPESWRSTSTSSSPALASLEVYGFSV